MKSNLRSWRLKRLSKSLLKSNAETVTVYRRPESVLVVVYDHQNQVLALQRNDDPTFWQSVTGSLEDGELPVETAKREVTEELGFDLTKQGYELVDTRQVNQYQIRPQWRHRYEPSCQVNTEYIFLLQVQSNQSIQLTEHSQYLWLTPAEAIEKMWSSTNVEAIKKFIAD